jgi:DNA-binding NarL/FixJ family response regulator
MENISVFLADWQVLFREGIHFTLSGEEDIDVIGEATDNEEAFNSIVANLPRVAILNAGRSKPDGINVSRRIKQNVPSVAVVLVTDTENEEQLFLAIKSGASALVTKEIDPEELVSVIRKVAQGAYPLCEALLKPENASRVIDEFEASAVLSKEAEDLLARLSLRESEILRHIADGNSIEQTTRALSINEHTIGRHLENIITKLAANDRNQAVLRAVQDGLPATNPGAKPG